MHTLMLPDHLSYSSISCYLQCPLKWKLHYLDQAQEEFISSSLVFGQAIHESVAAFLNSALTGDRLTPDEMLMVYRNNWNGSADAEIRYSNGETEEKLTQESGRYAECLALRSGCQCRGARGGRTIQC